jgi:hypothetical protein
MRLSEIAVSSFARRFVATIVVLVVLVAGFAVLTFLQGPKLSSAQVDTTAVVSKPGQTLRLFTNERVAAVRKSLVSISPAVPFTVSSSGQVISVQFTRPLAYATTYRLAVDGVTDPDVAQSSTLNYRFRTASPPLYYLHRSGSSAPDEIVKTGILSTGRSAIYSARRIQDFAIFDKALVVVTLDARGDSALTVVGRSGVAQSIPLPGDGTVDHVAGNSDTGILGFTFTSDGPTTKQKYSNTLFSVNPAGTGIPTPIKGVGGSLLSVLDWGFVPLTNDIVAQNIDQSIVLVDTSKANVVTPLGAYPELGAVAADGSSVVVSDSLGPLRVALPGGKATRLAASRFKGKVPYEGDAPAVVVPGGWIQDDQTYDAATGGFVSHLVFDTGGTARQLYALPNPRGTIGAIVASPNDEYVAIETTPGGATAASDGYAVNPRAKTVTTVFLDIATGTVVKSVSGFAVSW